MNRIDNSGMGIAQLGRDEDKFLAHVAPNEMVVPPVITPETKSRIQKEMIAAGLNPNEYTVGSGMSINPITGMPEFGFLKKAFKSIKKVVKKAAPVLGVASMFIPGVGPAISGALKAIPGVGGALSGGFNLLTGAGAAGGGAGAAGAGRFSRIRNFLNPVAGATGIRGGTLGPALRRGIGSFFGMGQQQMPSMIPMPPPMPIMPPNQDGFQFVFGGPSDSSGNFMNVPMNSFFTPSQEFPGLVQDPSGELYDPNTMQNEMASAYQRQTGTQQRTGFPGFGGGIMDFLSRKLLPQSVEDALKSGGFGNMMGDKNLGQFLSSKLLPQRVENFFQGPNVGAAGISALLGKTVYDAAKERQGGLAATPAVTMDSLGRYQLASALGTGGTRGEFGLGNTPPQLKFAKGGVAELDLRDGGESSGPGTGTSDDIPAMLSDGEFVMTAKATRGAGAYSLKNSPSGIEMIKGGSPSREEGVKNMRKLMKIFEAV